MQESRGCPCVFVEERIFIEEEELLNEIVEIVSTHRRMRFSDGDEARLQADMVSIAARLYNCRMTCGLVSQDLLKSKSFIQKSKRRKDCYQRKENTSPN